MTSRSAASGWRMVPVAALAGIALLASPSQGRGLGVEVWTDRGSDAVYQPGDRMEIRTRASDDAYLLVYEIDSEGYVRLLFPTRGNAGFVEGRATYRVPPEHADVELVVEEPVGQGYVVALAAVEPFAELPWFLRPYDAHAEGVGYEGEQDEEEGITREGRIVGDPFVAMERIRRRIVPDPDDDEAFATAYTSYYVHEQVRYPRYLCYDCHRPGHWAWWDGFDPYYTTCSVFTFRVNWAWHWGPSYWSGCVPYYYYLYRYDCPPRYRIHYAHHANHSSWDGWRRWKTLWGPAIKRDHSEPPPGYKPPVKSRGGWRTEDRGGRPSPPGFVSHHQPRGANGLPSRMPMGRSTRTPDDRGRDLSWRSSRGSGGELGSNRVPTRGALNRPVERDRDRDDAMPRPTRRGFDNPIPERREGTRQIERPRPRLERPMEPGGRSYERPVPERHQGSRHVERPPSRPERPMREAPPRPPTNREPEVEKPHEDQGSGKPRDPGGFRPQPPRQRGDGHGTKGRR